jgi:hypothetical protein
MIRVEPVEGNDKRFKVICKRRPMGFVEERTETHQVICGGWNYVYTREVRTTYWEMFELDGKQFFRSKHRFGETARCHSRKEAVHVLASGIGQRL